jgi:hypothetical protein
VAPQIQLLYKSKSRANATTTLLPTPVRGLTGTHRWLLDALELVNAKHSWIPTRRRRVASCAPR